MEWQGSKLKERLNVAGLTQAALAAKAGVTRQTVVDWINGQVPKGSHLLVICDALDIGPDDLFTEGPSPVQVAPRFRKRRNAKETDAVSKAATDLAQEYAVLLAPGDMPVLQRVVRRIDEGAAVELARQMRELAGLGDARSPVDYQHAFRLMGALGICVVFRKFPTDLKDYAFYTVVNGQRVVFVNASTNLLDLIFPMLHEAVHAVVDLEGAGCRSATEEDAFCDKVAGLVQYPDGYVDDVFAAITGRPAGAQVQMLKEFAIRHSHVVYGVVRRIEERHGKVGVEARGVHGADGNLRNRFPASLSDALMSDGPVGYVDALRCLSPIWFRVLLRHVDSLSLRKLSEAMGIESVLDAKEVREELRRVREGEVDGRPL